MGLHQRYNSILGHTHPANAAFAKNEDKINSEIRKAFEGMMKVVHSQSGASLKISILNEDGVQNFITTHADVLNSGFKTVKMDDKMRQHLENSDYVFSGIKAFHEMNEAFPSLIDSNGDRKPFEQFLNDVQNIDDTYNKNYLRSEYNFVSASGEMAAKWQQFEDDGDRYNLQYRTAGDDKVRPEHAELNNITLPLDDPFWNEYYPPNGWNCRCTVVQVLKDDYKESNPEKAGEAGESALSGKGNGMFKYNAGKEQRAVPAYNPYTITRCTACNLGGKLKLSKTVGPANTDLCQACKLLNNKL